MKQKILNHTSIMIILTVLLTFVAASFVIYGKFDSKFGNSSSLLPSIKFIPRTIFTSFASLYTFEIYGYAKLL